MNFLLGLLTPIFEWAIKLIFSDLATFIHGWSERRRKLAEETKVNEEAKAKYEAIVNNPNSTREERKDAEDKYLNS